MLSRPAKITLRARNQASSLASLADRQVLRATVDRRQYTQAASAVAGARQTVDLSGRQDSVVSSDRTTVGYRHHPMCAGEAILFRSKKTRLAAAAIWNALVPGVLGYGAELWGHDRPIGNEL